MTMIFLGINRTYFSKGVKRSETAAVITIGSKINKATVVILDPVNPTNNLWVTFDDVNSFTRCACETAAMLQSLQHE